MLISDLEMRLLCVGDEPSLVSDFQIFQRQQGLQSVFEFIAGQREHEGANGLLDLRILNMCQVHDCLELAFLTDKLLGLADGYHHSVEHLNRLETDLSLLHPAELDQLKFRPLE